MNFPVLRAALAVTFCALLGGGMLPAVARAEQSVASPFPTEVRIVLRTMSTASGFVIDGKQEVAFYQKLRKPAEKKTLTNEDRAALYRQSVQNLMDFVATQRKAVVTLSDEQRQSLSAILTDETNYEHSLFSIRGDDRKYAVDVRSGDAALTVIFGGSVVTVLTSGEKSNGLLNAQGKKRLSAWIQSMGKPD